MFILEPESNRMVPATPASQQLPAVESTVLKMVSQEPSVRTTELMRQASEHGLSEADVREAVWTLLDDGLIALTSDRRLTPTSR